jgi:hypothetical protein
MSKRTIISLIAVVLIAVNLSMTVATATKSEYPTITLTIKNYYTKKPLPDQLMKIGDVEYTTDPNGKIIITNTGGFSPGTTYSVYYVWVDYPYTTFVGSFTVKPNGSSRDTIWVDLGL